MGIKKTAIYIEGMGKRGERFLPLIRKRIKNSANYWIGNKGTIVNLNKGKEIGTISDSGYPQVYIGDKWIKSHNLVYQTWIGEIPEGFIVHHKDHKKSNNTLTNLELVTTKQNNEYFIEFKRQNGSMLGSIHASNQSSAYESEGVQKNFRKGTGHHRHIGKFIVNGVEFFNSREPASLLGISAYKLRELCRNNKCGCEFQPAARENLND